MNKISPNILDLTIRISDTEKQFKKKMNLRILCGLTRLVITC